MDNIERLFMQEVREKKRIGSNIFSRVSTRKGGSRQALKTPYLYMSTKERKQLNGEVLAYNMNEILAYDEFKKRSEEDQRRLMLHWRDKYRTVDIQDKMGVSRSIFYRIVDKLDIPKENTNIKKSERTKLTSEEMDRYSKELLDYDKYRELVLEQQAELLDAYIKEYGGVRAVQREWEGSDEGYLYNVRTRNNRRVKDQEEKLKRKESVAITSPKDSDSNENTQLSFAESIGKADSEEKSIEDRIKEAIDLLTEYGYLGGEEDNTINIARQGEPKKEPVDELVDTEHNSAIDIDTPSFSFNLNGSYNSKTIKRRLELALDVIEDESELLNLSIKITSQDRGSN